MGNFFNSTRYLGIRAINDTLECSARRRCQNIKQNLQRLCGDMSAPFTEGYIKKTQTKITIIVHR